MLVSYVPGVLVCLVIGAKFVGFESLSLTYPQGIKGWTGGTLVRLHVGLEDPADLIADLVQGLAAMQLG